MRQKTEEQLFNEYRDGINEALVVLLQKEALHLVNIASKYVFDRSTAHDVVQNATLELLNRSTEQRQKNPPKGISFTTHIRQLVKRRAIDLYRREKRRNIIHTEWADCQKEFEDNELAIFTETDRTVPLYVLSDFQKELYAFKVKGLSVSDICQRLDIDPQKYKSEFQTMKRRLKREIFHSKKKNG